MWITVKRTDHLLSWTFIIRLSVNFYVLTKLRRCHVKSWWGHYKEERKKGSWVFFFFFFFFFLLYAVISSENRSLQEAVQVVTIINKDEYSWLILLYIPSFFFNIINSVPFNLGGRFICISIENKIEVFISLLWFNSEHYICRTKWCL